MIRFIINNVYKMNNSIFVVSQIVPLKPVCNLKMINKTKQKWPTTNAKSNKAYSRISSIKIDGILSGPIIHTISFPRYRKVYVVTYMMQIIIRLFLILLLCLCVLEQNEPTQSMVNDKQIINVTVLWMFSFTSDTNSYVIVTVE